VETRALRGLDNKQTLWAANFLYTKALKPYTLFKIYQLSLSFIPFILVSNFLDAERLSVCVTR